MALEQFVQYLAWVIYLLVFLVAAARAIRHPRRADVDIALLFSAPTLIIGIGLLAAFGVIHAGPIPNAINTGLLLGMVYLLLRLSSDFAAVPAVALRAAEVAGGLLVLAAFVFAPPRPPLVTVLQIAYIVGLLVYATVALVRQAGRANGVTRRRLWAMAVGCLWLELLFVIDAVALVIPAFSAWTPMLTDLAGLASAVSFYLGVIPPAVLRRAWQEPELRLFLERAAQLPRLPDTAAIVAALEHGAGTSLGATRARVGLWDPDAGVLRYNGADGPTAVATDDATVSGQAFQRQQPRFSPDIRPVNPAQQEAARHGIRAVMAAPITAGERRLGVLTAYSQRAPIFADEDLTLVQLLADQAAVILESRALIDEAARVQAREEATRLKEDFLSSAAHDLKTPLTTLVALTELLERRAKRDPAAPADVEKLHQLKREAHRLKALVLELLDAASAEQGRLVGERTPVDLVALARDVCAHHSTPRHPCEVTASEPVTGRYDANRMLQLLENLVENAVKYSPEGGVVRVAVRADGAWNELVVSDAGIGIPREDLPHVFERFHRGSNVDDRHFAGMGLGLYICRGIVEQHGGRMWVESPAAGNGGHGGTTFHVALPAAVAEPVVRPAALAAGG